MTYVTEQKQIAKLYLKDRLLFDLILAFPFEFVFGRKARFMSILKMFRTKPVANYFRTKTYNEKIRRFFASRLKKVLKNEALMYNMDFASCFIQERVVTQIVMQYVKTVMLLFGMVYFFATIWDSTTSNTCLEESERSDCFNTAYGIDDNTSSNRVLTFYYFTFTTLSSVGLGDLVPKSNVERMVGSFIMLLGVAMYSYVQNQFLKMANQLKNFDLNQDENTHFQKFINIFAKFNKGALPQELRDGILKDMRYIWGLSKH